MTDCWKSYSTLQEEGYIHGTVNHSFEFVNLVPSTNLAWFVEGRLGQGHIENTVSTSSYQCWCVLWHVVLYHYFYWFKGSIIVLSQCYTHQYLASILRLNCTEFVLHASIHNRQLPVCCIYRYLKLVV